MAIQPQTSMLYFYCASAQEVKSVRKNGLSAGARALRLLGRLDEAAERCGDRILVIDADGVEGAGSRVSRPMPSDSSAAAKDPMPSGSSEAPQDPMPSDSSESSQARMPSGDSGNAVVDRIPPDAVLNADPYSRPAPVTAAGGFLTRRIEGELQLLLIYRRGRWDLPKGKLDPGESVEECAEREVKEELGIRHVALGRPVGSTVHGYLHSGRYMVKTTHWFEMTTSDKQFRPQAEEGIEEARWMSWRTAREKVGYRSLRRHMDRVRELL